VRYGVGVDRHAEAVDLAVERGLLEKSGTHFSLEGERIGNGRERAIEWLRANPDACERLVGRLREAGGAPAASAPPAAAAG
jgi:recombination protein RecA